MEDQWSLATVKLLRELNSTIRKNDRKIYWREHKFTAIILFLVCAYFLFMFFFFFLLLLVMLIYSDPLSHLFAPPLFSDGESGNGEMSLFLFVPFIYLTPVVGIFIYLSSSMFYTLSREPVADQLFILAPIDLGAWFRAKQKNILLGFLALVFLVLAISTPAMYEPAWGLIKVSLAGISWTNCAALLFFGFLYLETLERDGGTRGGFWITPLRIWLLRKGMGVLTLLFIVSLVPIFLFLPQWSFALQLLVFLLLQPLNVLCFWLWHRDGIPGGEETWRWAQSCDPGSRVFRRYQRLKQFQSPGVQLPGTPELPGKRGWWEFLYPLSTLGKNERQELGLDAVNQLFRVQLLRRPGFFISCALLLTFSLSFLVLWWQLGNENGWTFLSGFLFMLTLFFIWPLIYFDGLAAHSAIGSKFSLPSDSNYSYEFFHLMPFPAKKVVQSLYRFHFLFFFSQTLIPFVLIIILTLVFDSPEWILENSKEGFLFLLYSVVFWYGVSVILVGFLLKKGMFLSGSESPFTVAMLAFALLLIPTYANLFLFNIAIQGVDLVGIYGSGGWFWTGLDRLLSSPMYYFDPFEVCCFFNSFCSLPLLAVLAIYLKGTNVKRYQKMSIKR